MAEPTAKSRSGKTLKEQYVPLDARESNNFKATPFFKELASTVASTVIGTLIGYFVGKRLEPRNIEIKGFLRYKLGSKRVDARLGAVTGFSVGGLLGVFNHWKKTEGKRHGISSISSDLETILDPVSLAQQAQKEEALVAKMTELQELQAKGPHSEALLAARREAAMQEAGRNA